MQLGNQTIRTLDSLGAVWGVTVDAGESLTLRLNDSYYRAGGSTLPVSVAAGTAVGDSCVVTMNRK